MPASEITQEEIEQVCRDANILDFITSLPQCVIFHIPMTIHPDNLLEDSTHPSAAKAHNYPAVRNVCRLLPNPDIP